MEVKQLGAGRFWLLVATVLALIALSLARVDAQSSPTPTQTPLPPASPAYNPGSGGWLGTANPQDGQVMRWSLLAGYGLFGGSIPSGTSLPSRCDPNGLNLFLRTTGGGIGSDIFYCKANAWVSIGDGLVYRNASLVGQASETNYDLAFDTAISGTPSRLGLALGSNVTQCGNTVGPSCTTDETMYENVTANISATHNNTHVPSTYKETGPDPTFWGSGVDGAFTLPDLANSTSCGTTAGVGNCPAVCTGGCSGTALDATPYSCVCKLTPNSRLGAYQASSGTNKPSVVKQLTSLTIPTDWKVVIDRTVTADCLSPASSQLEFHVRGDCTINGKIDLAGMGACGGGGGTVAANNAGKAGGSNMLIGGAAGAATPTAGAVGTRFQWYEFVPGHPLPHFGGTGGAGGPNSTATGQGATANAVGFSRPGLGSTGGGSGGCDASATGTIGQGGHGGGGFAMVCMGTATVSGATIVLSGNNAGNGSTASSAGGGGSGNGLIVASSITFTSNTVTAAGGTGGTLLTHCGNGGNAAAGALWTYDLAGNSSCYGNCTDY